MPLPEIYDVDSTHRTPREFLICDFCFWAASAISTRRDDVAICPGCSQAVSRIPLGEDEHFIFNYEKERGVELTFTSRR